MFWGKNNYRRCNILIEIERLKGYLDINGKSIKVISFDVFDTLLIRLVPSGRVSQISARNLRVLLNKNGIFILSEGDILKSRYTYMRRIKKGSPFKDSEWILSRWLRFLAEQNDLNIDLMINIGRQAELDAECRCLRVDQNAVEAVEVVRDRGLSTIALSDMWLDQEWLKDLLERFGLFFDKIYTSGTSGYSKRRGTIFKKIERDLNLPGNAFLHIGNKLRADYLCPRLSRWNSLRMPMKHYSLKRVAVPKKFRIGLFRPEPFEQIIQTLNLPPSNKGKDVYYKLAHDYMAPLMIIFTIIQWRIFKKHKIDLAFYMARDAYVMKKVYDLLEELLPGSCPRVYIHLSRRAVALAHPDDLLQNAIPLPGKIGRKNVGEWLSNFSIGPKLHQLILMESSLNERSAFDDKAKDAIRKACLNHIDEIKGEQNRLRILIKDYLMQEAGRKEIKRIGFVDSGWACTSQDAVRTVFDDSYFLSGVYLGVSRQGQIPSSQNNKYGLLRDDFRRPPHHNPIESSAGVVRVWDILLREPINTVSSLQRLADGNVVPEFSDSAMIGERECSAATSILKGVEQGTVDRLKGVSLLETLNDSFSDEDFEKAATIFAQKITTCPSLDIAKAIMRLEFDEGTAAGEGGSLGWRGIKTGTCWYPGMLGKAGLNWISPLLKIIGKALY
jgi:FMN phosphatase YigB (HAD superfamily)